MGLMDIVSRVADALTGDGDEAQQDATAQKNKQGNSGGTIRIQYYRSFIAAPKKHKEIVRSVGLTKLNQIVERPDTPSMRGFVAKLPHLLRIVE